ncbi:hypothetical protein EKK58_03370 [Candidatus Dependentiae bacterium]|nr:MAG: hypothetical protein EKK58_03370 [Candidatus Dependentiae bacterium]
MKTLQNCLYISFFSIICLLTETRLQAYEQDTFGQNVAKAVLLKWSPKPEHIKTTNYAYAENQDAEYDSEKENDYED